jgi:hypothetical protein
MSEQADIVTRIDEVIGEKGYLRGHRTGELLRDSKSTIERLTRERDGAKVMAQAQEHVAFKLIADRDRLAEQLRSTSEDRAYYAGEAAQLAEQVREMEVTLDSITRHDKTRYDHHERRADGALPKSGGGTCWLTPKELAQSALAWLAASRAALSSQSSAEKAKTESQPRDTGGKK